MKLSDIRINPDNPRIIKDDKFKKLCDSIKEFPKMLELRPIIVDDTGLILGGNMRYRAIKELGLELKDKWVKKASDLTEEEKKRFVIEDNVPFGEWDWENLANEWNEEELVDWGIDLPKSSDDDFYTREIVTPTYEPSDEKPDLSDLIDKTKSKELLEEINKANISDEEKEFLKFASYRHNVFNYSKIADFYANSSKEVQELMEKSALVIIDYKKAIELGYVELTNEIADAVKEDYGE